LALILVFVMACFFYHASLVFYNALLTAAAPPEKQGFASGLGTGLGYLGVVCSLPIAHGIDQHYGRPYVFSIAAILFLLFSIPLFLFVPERKVDTPVSFRWNLWQTEWKKILKTLRTLPSQPKLLFFLGGNFFVVDALNSTIFWFLVYAREVFNPGQKTLILLMMGVNAAAFLFGILTGVMTDRWGAMKVMLLSSAALALSLSALALAASFWVFAAVCCIGGAFAISGIWTAGRKVLIELSPPEKVGEYFGLYGLTTKISVIGSLLFSIVADLAGFRQALWLLVFPATAGLLFLLYSAWAEKQR
jgi:MFS transporter, UMF1 family